MRRAVVLALAAAALVPLRLRAQAITAAPGGSMTSVAGMPFDVPIYVDMTARTDKLGSFALRLSWNPTVLKANGGSPGTFGGVTTNEDSVALGVVRVAGVNPAGVGGMISLGIVHFVPLLAQADTIRLTVTELFAAGTFADLLPSLTTHDGLFCPASGVYGDIDKDGAINSRDALIALSNAVGLDVSAFDISLGDVDSSGATNARDALIVLTSAVGLNVTGYRIGHLAGGSCALGGALAMQIVPDSLTLVVGQTVAFEARAADSTGALQTVTNAVWKSSNTTALPLFTDGTAQARDTGTVVVTAVRASQDSAQATVHIVARRTRQIVDAAATGARNQLGSAAFPFATIGQGTLFAQAGDTVEVRAGRYPEAVAVTKPLVLMGDTLPDGKRPVVAPDSGGTFGGITLAAGPVEVRDLAVDGYAYGVDLTGAAHVLLHGLRTTGTAYGVVADSAVLLLRVEDSRLTGRGAGYLLSGDGVAAGAGVDTLVVARTEISDFGSTGVSAPYVDSVAILASHIHDVGSSGVSVVLPRIICEICDVGPGPLVFSASPAVVVESTTVASVGGAGVAVEGIRSAAFRHNRISGAQFGSVSISGGGTGWARFVGDSIDQPNSEAYWLSVSSFGLDSLVMDSVRVHYDGYSSGGVLNVAYVRITNSTLGNVRGQGFLLSNGAGTGFATLDNVTVIGDPGCDLCATAFSFIGQKVSASQLTLVNFSNGIFGDSSGLTVAGSIFRHIDAPITWAGSATDTASRLVVTGSTFSGYSTAINASGGAMTVDSNTFQNGGSQALNLWFAQAPARVTRNQISGVPTAIWVGASAAGLPFTDTIADNVISDVSSDGIYADGGDTVSYAILRNAVSCTQSYAKGIDLEFAGGVVAGNRVSGCGYGVYAYDDGSVPRPVDVLADTISMSAGAYEAINLSGSLRMRAASNVVSADTAAPLNASASIYVYGSGYTGATAVVDSNSIAGGVNSGIYATGLDTVIVRSNAVRGVNAPYSWQGGIDLDGGFQYLALVRGNQVRGALGNGIRITNQNFLPDTAMVQVDSNLVDSSAAVGIQMDGGADSVTRNQITHSGVAGVVIASGADILRSRVTANNIVGNGFGVQAYGLAYSAVNNWWGDSLGPRCDSIGGCISTSVGDSVSAGLLWQPAATSAFTNTPLPAPVFRPLVVRAVAIPPARVIAAGGPDAPVARRERTARPGRAALVRPPRPAVAAPAPRHLTDLQARGWQRREQLRMAEAAAEARRDAALTAAWAQIENRRAALEQQEEQHRAQREAKRAASVARQAAQREALKAREVRQ